MASYKKASEWAILVFPDGLTMRLTGNVRVDLTPKWQADVDEQRPSIEIRADGLSVDVALVPSHPEPSPGPYDEAGGRYPSVDASSGDVWRSTDDAADMHVIDLGQEEAGGEE